MLTRAQAERIAYEANQAQEAALQEQVETLLAHCEALIEEAARSGAYEVALPDLHKAESRVQALVLSLLREEDFHVCTLVNKAPVVGWKKRLPYPSIRVWTSQY